MAKPITGGFFLTFYAHFNMSPWENLVLKIKMQTLKMQYNGRSQFFSKAGGHTGSNNIIMAFLPWNIVGCLLKKGLQRGGHGHPRTPPATPLYN